MENGKYGFNQHLLVCPLVLVMKANQSFNWITENLLISLVSSNLLAGRGASQKHSLQSNQSLESQHNAGSVDCQNSLGMSVSKSFEEMNMTLMSHL